MFPLGYFHFHVFQGSAKTRRFNMSPNDFSPHGMNQGQDGLGTTFKGLESILAIQNLYQPPPASFK